MGSRQNKILLIERFGVLDETARYTVKRYTSRKSSSGEDEWQHEHIRLEPLNPEFEAWDVGPRGFRRGRRVAARSGVRGIGRQLLIAWYRRGHRDLPWRATADPYRIWVSEIMLQQTRAQAVIPYYQRFLDRFPTVEALAAAAEDGGAGAVERAGLLFARAQSARAAQQIVAAGGFPRDYDAHPRAARNRRLHRRGHRQHRFRIAPRGARRQRAARGGAGGERRRRYRLRRAPASASARSRQSWLEPARARALQPGADGTGRHRLPAAQSALPGVPASRPRAARARRAPPRNCR